MKLQTIGSFLTSCFLILFLLLLFNNSTMGQITVTGIEGLTFNKTGSDYTLTLTDNFTLHGMQIEPNGLTLSWDQSADKFTIYGGLNLTVEGDTLDVELGTSGNPGLIITNDEIGSVTFGLTSDFSMKGITFNPRNLTFHWNKAADKYEIYGDVTVNVENDQIDATFGDEATPGITFANGTVEELNISISADFDLKGLSFHAHDATFYWNRKDNEYLFYGSFTLDVESDTVEVTLGDSSHPGIVINGGILTRFKMGINADFDMKGMSIDVQDMGIEWYRESSGDFFGFYGDVKLNIDGQSIDANFSDKHHPGLVYKSGAVTKIFLKLTSDFKLGNLEVKTNDLSLLYENEIYRITGEMTITDVWTLTVDLGEGSNSGIEVDVSGVKDRFVLESLVITLDNANLGSIDFKKIQLTFADNKLEEADMIASFPPGWEVEGKIQFTTGDRASINGATIVWETDNLEDAIEIPGTGMAIVYISGNLYDLNEPSKIHFDGTVGLTFGGPFEVDGYDLAFIYIGSNIGITQRALYIDTDIDVGAYKHDGEWHAMLGDGNLDIGLIWNDKYTLGGKFKIPTDPMIEASFAAQISENKSLDALIDVEFIVPKWVPYIHGKHYGSVDGAIRYLEGHPTSSYAAGWVKWDLWLTDIYVGAKYNFGTKHISRIGHSSIDDIKDEIEDDEKISNFNPLHQTADEYTQIIKSFVIEPKAPTMIRAGLSWDKPIDTAYVNVMGPDGIMNLILLTVVDDGDSNSVPTITTSENLTFVNSGTEIDFLIVPASSITEDKSIERASLTPGEYQIFFSYNLGGRTIDSLNIVAEKYHPMAQGTISGKSLGDGSINLDLDYWAYHPDSTLISIYATDSTTYNGKLLDHIPYGTIADDGSGSAIFNYVPVNMNAETSVYYYFVIDDGINVPFYSEFTQPITYYPPVYGTVTLLDSATVSDSISQSFMVYIDESGDGKYDTESTGGLEPSCVTNYDGSFEFHGLDNGTYTINIVLPSGYILDDTSPNGLPLSLNYSGDPLQVNFIIRKEN